MTDVLLAGFYFMQKAFWQSRTREEGVQPLLVLDGQEKSYSPETLGNLQATNARFLNPWEKEENTAKTAKGQ